MKQDISYKNCIILLSGFAGTGKLTTAKELVKDPSFRLVDNHTIANPILGLIPLDGFTPIPDSAWEKVAKIRDTVFETMRELSPSHFSFVITQEMIEGDPYPKLFYNLVTQLVADRKSTFFPVRLECNEAELVKRVKSANRRELHKTIDSDRSIHQVRNEKVFYSHHPNELTINNSDKSPKQVAGIILEHLKKIMPL